MEGLKYVSPAYEQRLKDLADLLVTPERYQAPKETQEDLGQLALLNTDLKEI